MVVYFCDNDAKFEKTKTLTHSIDWSIAAHQFCMRFVDSVVGYAVSSFQVKRLTFLFEWASQTYDAATSFFVFSPFIRWQRRLSQALRWSTRHFCSSQTHYEWATLLSFFLFVIRWQYWLSRAVRRMRVSACWCNTIKKPHLSSTSSNGTPSPS